MTLFEQVYSNRLVEQITKRGTYLYHAKKNKTEFLRPSDRWYDRGPKKWAVKATFFSHSREFAIEFGENVTSGWLYTCVLKKSVNLFNPNSYIEMRKLIDAFNEAVEDKEPYGEEPSPYGGVTRETRRINSNWPDFVIESYREFNHSQFRKKNKEKYLQLKMKRAEWKDVEAGIVPFLIFHAEKDHKKIYDGFVTTEYGQISDTKSWNIALFNPMDCIEIVDIVNIIV